MWHLHLREYQQDEGGQEITRSSGACERRLWSTVVRERYAVGRQASDKRQNTSVTRANGQRNKKAGSSANKSSPVPQRTKCVDGIMMIHLAFLSESAVVDSVPSLRPSYLANTVNAPNLMKPKVRVLSHDCEA